MVLESILGHLKWEDTGGFELIWFFISLLFENFFYIYFFVNLALDTAIRPLVLENTILLSLTSTKANSKHPFR